MAVLLPFYECLPHEQLEGLMHIMDLPVPKGMVWDGRMQVGVHAVSEAEGCSLLSCCPQE